MGGFRGFTVRSRSRKGFWSSCRGPWWSSWSRRRGKTARRLALRWCRRTCSQCKRWLRSEGLARTPLGIRRISGPDTPKASLDPGKPQTIFKHRLSKHKLFVRVRVRRTLNKEAISSFWTFHKTPTPALILESIPYTSSFPQIRGKYIGILHNSPLIILLLPFWSF